MDWIVHSRILLRTGGIMKTEDCILFSGAAQRSRGRFLARRPSVTALRKSISHSRGHSDNPQLGGIRVLTHAELQQGGREPELCEPPDEQDLQRTALSSAKFSRASGHQINNGQEVYVIGHIFEGWNVKGGTGWGRRVCEIVQQASVCFLTQDVDGWFHWTG